MDTTNNDVTRHYALLGKLIAEDRNSDESTCDLVLESEGKKFPVHKNVMMLVSKYFKKMFTVEMKEKYEGIVKMLQIPHQRLANLIEFIYTGRIIITEDNVINIMDDAEYTELEVLKNICATALLNLVSADNCLKFRACAQRYNLDEVFVKTNQEITNSFAEVVRQDDFVQLDVDDMSAVIKLKDKNLVRKSSVCLGLLVDETLKLAQSPFTGKLLIVGGEESPTYCVVYDVTTRQPTLLPNLNIGRAGATAVKVGSKVYVIGSAAEVDEDGYGDSDSNGNGDDDSDDRDDEDGQGDDEGGLSDDGGGHGDDEVDLSDDEGDLSGDDKDGLSDDEGGDESHSCEMLDLNEPTEWKVLPDMFEHRSYCGSGFIADHIYVTGGQDENEKTLSSCEKFDIHNKMWTKINNMLHAREEHGTVVCNGSLYCLGGYDDESVVLSSCERCDLESGIWNEIAPLNQARGGLACVVLDGNIYAIGGFCEEGQDLATVERLDPKVGMWENITSLKHDHGHLSACVIGNKIFVIGGKTVEVYDPTSNVWATAFEIEKPVSEAAVVAI